MKTFEVHTMHKSIAQTGGFELEYMPDCFDSECKYVTNELHTHDYYEILWFQEGGGIHTVDFTDYEVEKDTFFFITPGQLHKFDNSRMKGVIFKFLPEFLNDEYTTEVIFLKYSIFNAFDVPPKMVINKDDVMVSVNAIYQAIQREVPKVSSFGHHRVMQSLVRLLLVSFQRYNGIRTNTELNVTNNLHNHFIRFRELLEKEYKNLHNVKDYANRMGIGTKYLTTIVKECAHKTPLHLINERILLEAKRQLRYSNRLVKEIAFDLGYDDPSYFVKQFKHHMGMLPTEFREM